MKIIKKWLPIVILIIYITLFVICKIQVYKETKKRYAPVYGLVPKSGVEFRKGARISDFEIKPIPTDPEPVYDITSNKIFKIASILVFILCTFLIIINNKKNGGFKNNKLTNCLFIVLIISCVVINLHSQLIYDLVY